MSVTDGWRPKRPGPASDAPDQTESSTTYHTISTRRHYRGLPKRWATKQCRLSLVARRRRTSGFATRAAHFGTRPHKVLKGGGFLLFCSVSREGFFFVTPGSSFIFIFLGVILFQLVTTHWGRVPSVHGTYYPASAWLIQKRAYAMPSGPVPPITLLTGMVARCRLLAAHGAKSCLSVRTQPRTATGAPS